MGRLGKDSIPRRLAVIGGLSAVAFAGPVLDIYGKNPEVFVANRTSRVEIFLFGVTMALLIPVVSWAVLAIARALGGRAPAIAYRSMVAVLAVGSGLFVSRQTLPDDTIAAILLAIGTGAFVYWLARNVDVLFVIAALAVPLTLVMFLANSASARLIWGEPETTVGGAEIGSPAHIVMLQLDEMPLASIVDAGGGINERLFPSFARLAEEGTWYRNALSDSIATTQSVPAILTGVRGEQGSSPSHVDHPNNLFTLLGGSHDMHVIEWIADLCPEETCPDYAGRAPARFTSLLADVGVVYGHLVLPGETRESLPSIDNAWKGFLGQSDTPSGVDVEIEGLPVPSGSERQDWINWVQRLINGIEVGMDSTLSYAHLRAPHVPWAINPSGTHYERPEEYTEVDGVGGDGRWVSDPAPALIGFQRHLYQAGFLDKMLGRLLDHLDRTGTWDDTMVIVVADHGASFVPGEHRRWPYSDNRDDLYRVPLFIKYPGQVSGETVDLPAFGIDVLPTIVDALDIDTQWEFDGVSLLELEGERPHEPIRWCCNGRGVSTDVDVLFAQAERNQRWIPDQSSWLGVAAVGANLEMVGRPTTDIRISSDDDFRWSLELGAGLSQIDRSTGRVQTLVTGRIEADALPESDEVLVVVNEVVAGVGHLTRDSATTGALTGLIAEDLVEDGDNDVDLLIPDDDGGWVAGSNEDITFELVDDEGRVIDIGVEGSRRVQVDSVERTEGGWKVTGWAADVDEKVTPDMIHVFAGDRLLVSGPPNTDNENVVRWFESERLLRSGFELVVDESRVPEEADRFLVVAEFGDEAVADPASLLR